MLSNLKLKFYRTRRLSKSCTKDNKINIEEIRNSSDICEEKYLTNRNLSILIDKQLESDVVDNVYLRQKQHVEGTSNSSTRSSQNSYVLIASEEMPVVLNDTNWEFVNCHDITESIRKDSAVKEYCSPKCSSAWFLKIRREILRNRRNKIYPVK
ncbi:Uncharacterized protein DBV15_06745 [Temnothorax longispinosus]|uniref:Uncharacterized protein n=2 Tax=Temnothorax longispinosus TaxID=300112 RepID=A0A4S2JSG1_9HYME|nr:Uncharacterized protein DBV15_06745 [Temnothorax longispinosus]